MRGVGNISTMKGEMVVNTLFRVHRSCRHRKKLELGELIHSLEHYLRTIKIVVLVLVSGLSF